METRTQALKQILSTLPIPDPVTVEASAPMSEAARRLGETNEACALVMEGTQLVGVLTSRDFVRRYLQDAPDPEAPVKAFMTPDPITVDHTTAIGDAAETMHAKGFRNLPFRKPDGSWSLLTVRRIIKYLAAHYPEEVYNLPPKLDQIPKTVEGG